MHIAVCRITLHAYASQSLKDKRRIVQSLVERLRQRFPLAVAEVGGQDTWQIAEIGMAAVSSEEKIAREQVDRAVEFARSVLFDAEITNVETDLMSY